jgi:hypothetical protein
MADQAQPHRTSWWYIGFYIFVYLLIFLLVGTFTVGGAALLATSLGWPVTPVVIGLFALLGLAVYVYAYQRAKIHESLVIHRPVEAVFRFMATDFFENRARWNSTSPSRTVETAQTSPGPMGVGVTGREVVRVRGRESEWTLVVTDYALNQAFAYQATAQRVAWVTSRYQFAPVADGTKVTFRYEYRYSGLRQIMMPLHATYLRAGFRSTTNRIRQLLEEGDYPTGSTSP